MLSFARKRSSSLDRVAENDDKKHRLVRIVNIIWYDDLFVDVKEQSNNGVGWSKHVHDILKVWLTHQE